MEVCGTDRKLHQWLTDNPTLMEDSTCKAVVVITKKSGDLDRPPEIYL